jgi:hypothetical protein
VEHVNCEGATPNYMLRYCSSVLREQKYLLLLESVLCGTSLSVDVFTVQKKK